MLCDGLHLNDKGNSMLCDALLALIRSEFPELKKENLTDVVPDWKLLASK